MSPPTAIEPPGVEDTHAVTILEPLRVNGVPSRRSKSAQMAKGVAPHTSSDVFKGPVGHVSYSTRLLLTVT